MSVSFFTASEPPWVRFSFFIQEHCQCLDFTMLWNENRSVVEQYPVNCDFYDLFWSCLWFKLSMNTDCCQVSVSIQSDLVNCSFQWTLTVVRSVFPYNQILLTVAQSVRNFLQFGRAMWELWPNCIQRCHSVNFVQCKTQLAQWLWTTICKEKSKVECGLIYQYV